MIYFSMIIDITSRTAPEKDPETLLFGGQASSG